MSSYMLPFHFRLLYVCMKLLDSFDLALCALTLYGIETAATAASSAQMCDEQKPTETKRRGLKYERLKRKEETKIVKQLGIIPTEN